MNAILNQDELDPLDPREERYCEEYLLDLNQTKAAIRAGYAVSNAGAQASRMMTKANILARIATLKAERSERVQIEADWVLRRLVTISDRCMQAEPVMVFDPVEKKMVQQQSADGYLLFKFDSSGANKATELIGKHIGFFLEHNKQKPVPGINYALLSREALAEVLSATAPAEGS